MASRGYHRKIGKGMALPDDAVAVFISENSASENCASENCAETVADGAIARQFVCDAFTHCKFIGYVAAAQPLLLNRCQISQNLTAAVSN